MRIKQGIPSEELAAKFGVTPEELTPPWLWVRHLEEERVCSEREERRRIESEERRLAAFASAATYVPPPSIGCPICDHEKHYEIHAKLFAGMTEAHIDALSEAYGLTAGAIHEHYNGHPVLQPQPKIPPPGPTERPARPGTVAAEAKLQEREPQSAPSSDLWDRIILALNIPDDIILKAIFEEFRKGEPSRQAAEYILQERNKLRRRDPKREEAAVWLLEEVARLNPSLTRFAEEAK